MFNSQRISKLKNFAAPAIQLPWMARQGRTSYRLLVPVHAIVRAGASNQLKPETFSGSSCIHIRVTFDGLQGRSEHLFDDRPVVLSEPELQVSAGLTPDSKQFRGLTRKLPSTACRARANILSAAVFSYSRLLWYRLLRNLNT